MDNQKWWYSYDPKDFSFSGMVFSEKQPENATNVEIGSVSSPVWDKENSVWVGNDVDKELETLKENYQNSTTVDEDLEAFKKSTSLTIANLILQIAELKTSGGK